MYPVVHSEPFALESSITAEAVTDVGALEFTNDAVLSAIRRNPDFAVATIDFYSRYVNLLLFRQLPAFFYSLPRGSLKTATVA